MATIYERMDAAELIILELQAKHDDSGWIDLPLSSGVIAYNDAQKPQYRKVGNEVSIRGVIKNMAAPTTATVFANIPEGFRPSHKIIESGAMIGSNFWRFDIETNGEIRFGSTTMEETPVAATWYSLGIIRYYVD